MKRFTRRWHRLLYRVPFGWRYRWQRAWAERPRKPLKLDEMDRTLKVVWGDPRHKAELESATDGSRLIAWLEGRNAEPQPDFDWWEPTSKWRREDARARDFGV